MNFARAWFSGVAGSREPRAFCRTAQPAYPTIEASAVLHSIWHLKPRLFAQGVVANPRDTCGYRCGLRLALSKNPSVLNVPSRAQHYTSDKRTSRTGAAAAT
ncbi:hypothetical protein, partial [Polaromonas sp.]|uniref:hypothetical protein n=1 Tax=Polaromonas sp. TaxID=1869339 RepID=UPI002734E650